MKPIELRHYLHQYPELSGAERNTQDLLHKLVAKLPLDRLERIGGRSLILSFNGKHPGPQILFRADIDALPIPEDLPLSYQSKNKGVSHKCGHDGHTAIMFALLNRIAQKKPKRGGLHILFQSSEENGKGAAAVLQDPKFKNYPYDYAYALHNIPGFSEGKVLSRTGNFNAGACSISFDWKGLETHAAHPHKGRNPATLIAQAIQLAANLQLQDVKNSGFFLCTPVYSLLGSKDYGISPGQGTLHFTARAWQGEVLNQNLNTLEAALKLESEKQGLELKVNRFEAFWPIINDEQSKDIIDKAAIKAGLETSTLEEPFSWGEDFGLFLKGKKGAMFGLGAGENCKVLHHPEYDFPDSLIDQGAEVFYQIYLQHLDEEHQLY